ncbi:MAG TPA: CaiB/BaiF CoA-transferase family protein [Candidatus Rifleibacterium sp.]|nr:CaiB/BaiF CoA-transferase family protein [Candidatus Rifleibacterium sp.]HPT45230.1 CaiB/BaiF CoA-transferase family protein [Candidatus Rifleibacterium sp.]
MSGPLHGIKVVDLTRVLAGPFCTMTLADLGAEIIKIEKPGSGDDSRAFGPHLKGESAYFMSINRGKKSLTLDLKSEQGREILLKLVEKADVLVENFKPGVMKKLGLDYDTLKQTNPRLIYCASSGFGQTGPYSSRPAYDLIIQGMGGLMSITGPDASQPTKVGSSIADIIAGVFSAIGILSALYSRNQTGRGQMVDIAMLDCMVAILENAVARYTGSGVDPVPIGNRHPSIAPFTSVKTADGYINIACGNDQLWAKLCEIIGHSELIAHQHFVSNQKRCEHMPELLPILDEAMRYHSSTYWLEKLEAGQVPAGPINSISKVLADPQVLARNMLVELTHPVAGLIKMPGSPVKLSETPAEINVPAPVLGQHTDEILAGLGYSDQQITEFRAKAII